LHLICCFCWAAFWPADFLNAEKCYDRKTWFYLYAQG
jgi:hypothetical protein